MSSTSAAPVAPQAAAVSHGVLIKVDETISLTTSRDGGMESMEVKGIMMLAISDPNYTRVKVHFTKNDDANITYQVHPNVNKQLMQADNIIALKAPEKPFPVNTELGVLKWRFKTNDESFIPMTINCWPTVKSDGSCNVNIDYELVNRSVFRSLFAFLLHLLLQVYFIFMGFVQSNLEIIRLSIPQHTYTHTTNVVAEHFFT